MRACAASHSIWRCFLHQRPEPITNASLNGSFLFPPSKTGERPFFLDHVESQSQVDNALAYGRLRASRDDLEDQRLYLEAEISSEFNFEDIVGNSSTLKRVFEQVSIVAPTDTTVLLHRETGTGKEMIARAIHNLSSRRDCTFVRMNCAAIPSGLVEIGRKRTIWERERGLHRSLLPKKAELSSPIRVRFFSTKSGTSAWNCNQSCCVPFRSRSSSGWGVPKRSMSMRGSSPPHTGIFPQ